MADLRWKLRSLAAGAVALPEHWRSGVAYNPLSSRAIQDPYPTYARLRARSPVHRSRLLDGWVFTRYALFLVAIPRLPLPPSRFWSFLPI